MIRLREITGQDNHLEAFAASYLSVGGHPLESDYLRRCRVYAFMDSRGNMFGGFCINVAPPFRSLDDMPEAERQRILGLLDLDQTFEGTCMWIARELRGTFTMMRFWAEVLHCLWRFPRRDMLACTVWKSLLRQYSVVPFTILYEGKIHTPRRVLEKTVFVCRGKQGFAQGIVREAMRRAWKLMTVRLTPRATLPPARQQQAV